MNTNIDPQRVALLYARISVSDRNVPKVANQLADLRNLADRHGLTVVGTYEDDGLSAAKAENRPSFDRLLTDLPNHPGAVVLATEESRLARNELEKASLSLACANVGATWLTVRDGAVDPATAAGALMSGIRGAIDSFESRRKAERQKSANAHRRSKGKPYTNCVVPFGWNPDRITVCENEADLIRRGTARVLAGQSFHPVIEMFRDSGVKPRRGGQWTGLGIQRILTRWRNAAVMSFGEVPTDDPAEWQPIISRDDLKKCRKILLSRTGKRETAKHLLSSIALCSCGSYMVSATMNGVTNYVCAARRLRTVAVDEKHTSIRADHLNAAARAAVIDTYFLMPRASTAGDTEADELADLHTELRKVRDAQAVLLDGFTDPDVPMTKVVYVRKNSELIARETDLTEKIAQVASASAHAKMLTEARRLLFSSRRIKLSDAAKAKTELAEVFDGLDLENRRLLVRSAVTIVVRPGRGMSRVLVRRNGPNLTAEESDI